MRSDALEKINAGFTVYESEIRTSVTGEPVNAAEIAAKI